MKRILMLMFILFLSLYIFAQEVIIIEEDMVWQKKNGNPSGKSLVENLELLRKHAHHPNPVIDLAIETWGGNLWKWKTFTKGDSMNGGSTFGGRNQDQDPSSYPIIRKGGITIGFEEEIVAKYIAIYFLGDQAVLDMEDLNLGPGLHHIEKYTYYYFGDNYAGYVQCDNLGWGYDELLIKSCESEIVYKTKYKTKWRNKPSKTKFSYFTWVSYAQDHFPDGTADSTNYGNYYISDLKNTKDGKQIQSLLGGFTGKWHINSWAVVGAFEAGYNDGPIDWKVNFLGIEKNWKWRWYLQFGPEYRYREYGYWKYEITNWITPNNYEFKMQETRLAIFDFGAYLQLEYSSMYGDTHVKLRVAQGFRWPTGKTEAGTGEIQLNAKIEPSRFYIFASGRYQNMPTTKVDSIYVPLQKHISTEGRFGGSFGEEKKVTIFTRYRNIQNETFEDVNNQDWATYNLQGLGVGALYRPVTLFGISDLHAEFIASYYHVVEKFKNSLDREDWLAQFKITFSYSYRQ